MINWFKRKKDNFDPSRRKFIRDAAGLAALTAVAVTAPGLPLFDPESATDRINKMVAGGVIEGETFYLYEPITLDTPDLIIRNCSFEVMTYMHDAVIFGSNARRLLITDCYFSGNGFLSGTAIRVNAQSEHDMSQVFQPACNIHYESGSPKTVYLPTGKYRLKRSVDLKGSKLSPASKITTPTSVLRHHPRFKV